MNNKINNSEEINIAKEFLNAFSDTTKMDLSNSLNAIHENATKSKYLRISTIPYRAIAAAIISIIIVGGVLLFNKYVLNNNQLASQDYKDVININTTRNGNNNNYDIEIKNGIKYYQNMEYELALKSFNLEPKNNVAILYSGLCYVELDNLDLAENKFKYLIKDNSNLFVDQAEWNLGLCYLKAEKLDLAINIFNKISQADGAYQKKAIKILHKLQ